MPLMTHQEESGNWSLTSNGVEIVEPMAAIDHFKVNLEKLEQTVVVSVRYSVRLPLGNGSKSARRNSQRRWERPTDATRNRHRKYYIIQNIFPDFKNICHSFTGH